MKYLLLSLLGAGLWISFSSCTKFLEEKPTGSLTTDANLTSKNSGVALAGSPYRYLTSWTAGAVANGGSLPGSLEYACGKAYSANANARYWAYQSDAISGDLDYFIAQWNNWYAGIRAANYAIAKIPEVTELTPDEISRFIGEVRSLRAFYYFCLVRYFGDVVMNTDPVIEDLTIVERPRTSLKTIYDKVIIPDLEYAVNESGLIDQPSADGHITKYVARAILADVYLTCAGYPYQEIAASNDTTIQWCTNGLWTASDYPVNSASAIDFLSKAKTQLDVLYGKYTLGIYDDLHNPAMDNKGEAIFQAQFQSGIVVNGMWGWTMPNSQGASIDLAYELGTFVPSMSYYNSYNPIDKRLQDRQMFYYSDTKTKKYDPNEGPTAKFDQPYLYKYYDYQAVKVTGQSSLNWSFYRYADILLMLTEVNWTLTQLGIDIPEADVIKGINLVRDRALLSNYSGPDLSLLKIMSERAYELVFENKMIWDMRRTRRALVDGEGQFTRLESLNGHQPNGFNYQFNEKHFLSPMPLNEILNNKKCLQNFNWTPKQIDQP